VLHLSTRWGFTSLRKLAMASVKPPTPYDQLLLARAYAIDDWVVPALSALCERTAPLSLDEARQMKIEDVVTVATVREHIRDQTVRVDGAEIPRRVEAAQAGKLSSFDRVIFPDARPTFTFGRIADTSNRPWTFPLKDANVISANPKSGVAEQGADLTMGGTASPSATGTVNATSVTAAPPVDPGLAARGEDDADNLVSSSPVGYRHEVCNLVD
jgi:hypothetical protein